jgi:hypothetical protein
MRVHGEPPSPRIPNPARPNQQKDLIGKLDREKGSPYVPGYGPNSEIDLEDETPRIPASDKQKGRAVSTPSPAFDSSRKYHPLFDDSSESDSEKERKCSQIKADECLAHELARQGVEDHEHETARLNHQVASLEKALRDSTAQLETVKKAKKSPLVEPQKKPERFSGRPKATSINRDRDPVLTGPGRLAQSSLQMPKTSSIYAAIHRRGGLGSEPPQIVPPWEMIVEGLVVVEADVVPQRTVVILPARLRTLNPALKAVSSSGWPQTQIILMIPMGPRSGSSVITASIELNWLRSDISKHF